MLDFELKANKRLFYLMVYTTQVFTRWRVLIYVYICNTIFDKEKETLIRIIIGEKE